MTEKRTCLQRLFLFFCTLVCAAAFSVPAAFAQDARSAIEANEDTSRYIDVPGRGMTLFYPQKNPLYKNMNYEYKGSPTYRSFGEGGCAPAAASSALMALIDEEALTVLKDNTKDGKPFSLCVHAINAWSCSACKERMPIVTPEDHRVYLPVVLGSYACGNNPEGERWRRAARSAGGSGGTGAQFLHSICPLLSLECTEPEDISSDAWLDEIDENTVAVVLSASSPFTGSGHYVTVVWADDEYFYLFDPLAMGSYDRKHDYSRCLQVIEPGLVKVSREKYSRLNSYAVYVISSDAQPAAETQQ